MSNKVEMATMLEIGSLISNFELATGGVPARTGTLPTAEESALVSAIVASGARMAILDGREYTIYKNMPGGPGRLHVHHGKPL